MMLDDTMMINKLKQTQSDNNDDKNYDARSLGAMIQKDQKK